MANTATCHCIASSLVAQTELMNKWAFAAWVYDIYRFSSGLHSPYVCQQSNGNEILTRFCSNKKIVRMVFQLSIKIR